MTVYAITGTKKGRTGIAPTYLQTTRGTARSRADANRWRSDPLGHKHPFLLP